MNSAIFSTGNQSYHIATIIYAGPVQEIPAERRRNENTHYFRIVTPLGVMFPAYKDVESARKARGALGGMLDALKPHAFKHGNEFIDPASVVTISNVLEFKKPNGEYTHGFVVKVLTNDEKNQEIWIRYRNEDHARKGRKAMWAAMHTANGLSSSPRQEQDAEKVMREVEAEAVPF